MIYALNLFNFIPGKEDVYRDYSSKAGKLIYGLGGRIVCSGHQPIRHLKTDDKTREQFIIVEFPSEDAFNKFYSPTENQVIHQLREASTRDYLWSLFKTWDLRKWLNE
jgi:uncharacterized protein (DUF1330 family)